MRLPSTLITATATVLMVCQASVGRDLSDIGKLSRPAGVWSPGGKPAFLDYRKTFFDAFPDLNPKEVTVHHAIEQQVMKRYPGVIRERQLHSLENLRGIPQEINKELHLSKIRKEWNNFYRSHPTATQRQLARQAKKIDDMFGAEFTPGARKALRTSGRLGRTGASRNIGGRIARAGGKAVPVVNLLFAVGEAGFIAAQTNSDVQAFSRGNMDTDVIVVKASLRTTETGLVVVSTIICFTGAGVPVVAAVIIGGILVSSADIGVDVFSESRKQEHAILLKRLERSDRFAITYRILQHKYRSEFTDSESEER